MNKLVAFYLHGFTFGGQASNVASMETILQILEGIKMLKRLNLYGTLALFVMVLFIQLI